eukprot:7440494-Pyramimonas_sp.AAC.1
MAEAWAGFWDDAKERLRQSQWEQGGSAQLERSSVERVRAVLRSFKASVGLGGDCLNPRSFDMLDDDFVERLIDIIMG